MKKAKRHPKESKRIKALDKVKILNTPGEKDFDDIALIAAKLFKVPMVLISFVGESKQWFKSKIGVHISETERDISFCAHTILEKEFMVVNDSDKDDRFFDNPMVKEGLKIKFYAGSHILEPESKLPIGTLCILDSKSREFSKDEIQSLQALARQVQNLLDLKIKVDQITKTLEQTTFQRVAFEKMTEGVVVQNSKGEIIDFNPSALEVLEMTPEQLTGKTSMDEDWVPIKENGDAYPGENHPAMKTLRSGDHNSDVMGINIKDEITKWISVSSNPVFMDASKKPTHVVTTFGDITEERINQHKLIQSAKMTSLGEMAGEIAHEINTPLTVLSLATHQVLKSLKTGEVDKSYIRKKVSLIDSTVQRISTIIRGLRSFVRPTDKDPQVVASIEEILKEALALSKDRLKETNIKVDMKINKNFMVHCVPTLIIQVILNLLNNACDAVHANKKKWIKITAVENKPNVKITVVDSGLGIQSEIADKIMESFYTTKSAGKGTGLGLSISKSIVESIGGKIYYEAVKGHTGFSVELPIYKKPKQTKKT